MTIRQLLLAILCVSNITITLAPPPSADELSATLSGGDDMDPMAALDAPDEQAVQSGADQQSDQQEESPNSTPDQEKPKDAPAQKIASQEGPAQVVEINDGPLFAPANPESAVPSRKQMFDQTESAAIKVRELMRAIDEVKSAKMNEYIVLDGELDAHAKEVGLARGKAADSIGDIKDALWQQIDAQITGADDASQKQVADHKQKVDELQAATDALSGGEAAVVAALKELSDSVSVALDSGSSVVAKRRELRGVVDDGAAQKLFEEIKAIPDQLQTVKDGLTAGDGVVTKLDAAMAEARTQAAKVKELVAALKAINLDVSKTIQTFAGDGAPVADAAEKAPSVEPVEEVAVQTKEETESVAVEDEAPVESKKKTRRRPSGLEKMVKGTWAEGFYYWLADAGTTAWRMFKPVGAVLRSWLSWGATKVGKTAQQHLPAIPEKAPEAEVTWGALAKKFLHKLYVSVGRGARRVYQWWHGTYDPLAIKKNEKSVSKKSTTDAPASQSVGEVAAKTSTEPIAEKSTAPVGPAGPKAPAAVPDAGPVVPAVPTKQEQEAAVAQEVAAAAAEVTVNDKEVAGAQSAVAGILAAADAQATATKKKVEKVRKDVAFVKLGG